MSKCEECAKFESWLKEGETPFQRLEREREDVNMCLRQMERLQRRIEELESKGRPIKPHRSGGGISL